VRRDVLEIAARAPSTTCGFKNSFLKPPAACNAHDEIVARYPDEPLPLGRTEAEQAAVKRWWAADRAAEMAAFVAWRIHPHSAFLEVTV
jgi:hypothetical protein